MEATHQIVGAPVGEPAMFYREGSETGARFEQELEERALLR